MTLSPSLSPSLLCLRVKYASESLKSPLGIAISKHSTHLRKPDFLFFPFPECFINDVIIYRIILLGGIHLESNLSVCTCMGEIIY